MRLAPFAVFLDIDFALHKLSILAGPVIDTTALGAGEFEKLILRHREPLYSGLYLESIYLSLQI